MDDFVRKLEVIELPNQLVAVLGDPLLQKFLQLKSSPAVLRRVDSWLIAFFEAQLEDSGSAENAILEMLSAIREYARYTKVSESLDLLSWVYPNEAQLLPPACLAYIRSMLPSWNGSTGRVVVLEILTYVPLGPFEGKLDAVGWLGDC